MSFFASRWVPCPDHVTELGGEGLPAGFRAAGVAAGIKPSGAPDVGVIVCDAPEATSAARFTASGTQAPPVLLCRERARLDALRAVVVNAGNANAATGRPGFENAAKMQGAGALVAGVSEDQVAVCSTGVIGVPLPMDKVTQGIVGASHALAPDGDAAFSAAIQTTDAFEKRARLQVTLPSGTVTLTGQAKGSFERISVDGQLSPSDTVILQCSGASGVAVEPETEDELRFGEALDALMRQLALLVVCDGEGARRAGRVVVRGGQPDAVDAVARAVANSPLVKTALYGGDPNWGRIIQAVGAAMPGTAPLPVDIAIEGVQVCARGGVVPHDAQALAGAVARDEVDYEISLPGEGAETEVFFSDLGHEYVTINADYTT
jgi:glutamate N-acetyltransferase/amino-acid N-acetyltransferase